MTCVIPLWLTLIALSPCDAWHRFQDDFSVAEGKLYWSTVMVDPAIDSLLLEPPATRLWPIPNPYLGGLGPLIYEEVPGTLFPSSSTGDMVAGETRFRPFEQPHIRIATDSPLRPGVHELLHWIVCRTKGRASTECAYIQHGTSDDPFVKNLLRAKRGLFWPIQEGHSYFPKEMTVE